MESIESWIHVREKTISKFSNGWQKRFSDFIFSSLPSLSSSCFFDVNYASWKWNEKGKYTSKKLQIQNSTLFPDSLGQSNWSLNGNFVKNICNSLECLCKWEIWDREHKIESANGEELRRVRRGEKLKLKGNSKELTKITRLWLVTIFWWCAAAAVSISLSTLFVECDWRFFITFQFSSVRSQSNCQPVGTLCVYCSRDRPDLIVIFRKLDLLRIEQLAGFFSVLCDSRLRFNFYSSSSRFFFFFLCCRRPGWLLLFLFDVFDVPMMMMMSGGDEGHKKDQRDRDNIDCLAVITTTLLFIVAIKPFQLSTACTTDETMRWYEILYQFTCYLVAAGEQKRQIDLQSIEKWTDKGQLTVIRSNSLVLLSCQQHSVWSLCVLLCALSSSAGWLIHDWFRVLISISLVQRVCLAINITCHVQT